MNKKVCFTLGDANKYKCAELNTNKIKFESIFVLYIEYIFYDR